MPAKPNIACQKVVINVCSSAVNHCTVTGVSVVTAGTFAALTRNEARAETRLEQTEQGSNDENGDRVP